MGKYYAALRARVFVQLAAGSEHASLISGLALLSYPVHPTAHVQAYARGRIDPRT